MPRSPRPLALVIALGGTSYAAGQDHRPRHQGRHRHHRRREEPQPEAEGPLLLGHLGLEGATARDDTGSVGPSDAYAVPPAISSSVGLRPVDHPARFRHPPWPGPTWRTGRRPSPTTTVADRRPTRASRAASSRSPGTSGPATDLDTTDSPDAHRQAPHLDGGRPGGVHAGRHDRGPVPVLDDRHQRQRRGGPVPGDQGRGAVTSPTEADGPTGERLRFGRRV